MDEIEKDMPIELEPAMSSESEQLPGMPKEYSGWDVYNNEAKKVDTALVNDWRDSLNSLLLSAFIFAVILTVFIIESKKLLESDPSEAMLEVMIFLTNNLANGTFTPYSRPQFEPAMSAVTINCLFFASLSASLVAALASVVALQWVADYDAEITRGGSSPEGRARRRQFRYAGVVGWKMSEMIAALPLLLYSSLTLFFIGLTLWMWTVHQTVGAVVAGGMGIAALFYATTTLISVASVSAPFRTPLSRLIYSSVYPSFFSIVDSLGRSLRIPSSRAWLQERHQRYTDAVERDNDGVNRRYWLGVDALSWLANHLSISQDSYDRLLLLVNELRKQDPTHFITPQFNEAPWFSIFDLLAWRNFSTVGQYEDINKEKMRSVAILGHCYRIPAIYAIIRPNEEISYHSDNKVDEYWSQACDISRTQWSPPSPFTSLNSLFLLLRDIPLPSKDTVKQIEFVIRLSRWRNSPKLVQEAPMDEGGSAIVLPVSPRTSAVLPASSSTDEDDLWLTRYHRSRYQAAVGRMMRSYTENEGKMAPSILDALSWRFESLLLGEEGYALDAMPCLSRPLLYHEAFEKHKIEYNSLHCDFTLLLARNLTSFSGAERARRVKEVLTMMWVCSERLYRRNRIKERRGIESFFAANKNIIYRWVRYLDDIPHSLEILKHLSLAQAKQPDIGSLWHTAHSQVTPDDLLPALTALDNVIAKGVTPEQHLALIELVCQDMELSSPGTSGANVGSDEFRLISLLRDPCLNFIGMLAAGVEIELAEDPIMFKASWIRIAKHLMIHYEGTDSSIILKLQASAWFLVPDYVEELCARALRKPQALARLKRIFEYPVQCHHDGHDIREGHLLLHVLRHFHRFSFPVNIPTLTEFLMKDQYLNCILAVLILSDGYEELLREQMHQQGINEWCGNQLLEMVGTLRLSQYSTLAILPAVGTGRYADDLAAFSICVHKALDLPDDEGAASFIPPIVSYIQGPSTHLWTGSASEQAIAMREATKAIKRLYAHLARLRFSSRTNSSILSCVRATGSFDPTIGCLPPYTDKNAIF